MTVRAALAVTLFAVWSHGSELASHEEAGCESRHTSFASEQSAALRLGECYRKRSAREDTEYIAGILQIGDAFRFVVMRGHRGRDHVQLAFRKRAGEQLVALWHTHGAPGSFRELFSPTDTGLVKRIGLPFYLTVPSGELRVFRPGDRRRARAARTAVRPPRGSALGRAIEM